MKKLFLILALVPRLLLAQSAFQNGSMQNGQIGVAASGGGGGGDTAFVTSVAHLDGSISGLNWEIGMGVTPPSTITITAIGRYCYSGDSGTHTLNIRSTGCTILGTVSINMSGATPGTWVYATLGTPVVVTGGTKVFINSVETSASGDHWGYNATTITTAFGTPGTDTQAQDNNGCTGHAGQTEGPVNFLFHY